MLGKIGDRRRGWQREWDGWMVWLTQWTWLWTNSGRWSRTGKPDMLQSVGSRRVRHDGATALLLATDFFPALACKWALVLLIFHDKHSHKHWKRKLSTTHNSLLTFRVKWLEVCVSICCFQLLRSHFPSDLCSLVSVTCSRVKLLPPTPSRTYMLPDSIQLFVLILLDLLTLNPKSIWMSAEWICYSHISRRKLFIVSYK